MTYWLTRCPLSAPWFKFLIKFLIVRYIDKLIELLNQYPAKAATIKLDASVKDLLLIYQRHSAANRAEFTVREDWYETNGMEEYD